jgi:sugar phosphate isomerase/epimerase
MDPSPSELGHKFKATTTEYRNIHWRQFIESIRKLLQVAEKVGVRLFIENNVCTKENVQLDGTSPLLCTDSDEIIKLINEIESKTLGLLVDTGHLKVSAATFDFSKTEFINKIIDHIGAFHHSDNNSEADTNSSLSVDYWFLPFMNKFIDCYHILEVCDQSIDQIRQQFELLHRSCNYE